MVCDFSSIADMAKGTGKNTIFLGDAAAIYSQEISSRGFATAPKELLLLRASSIGAIALESIHEAQIDANQFEPFYIRPSQAEREHKSRL
jgi:tRNA A37 threonylcarbamoyladenosine modification protein TsaB